MSVLVPFTKMVGTGNDFIVVDTRRHSLGALKTKWPQVAKAMCDRRSGVGADGLLVLEPSRVADCKMRVFNPDGSEAEMCGNGARCVARYIVNAQQKLEERGQQVTIQTKAGVVVATVGGDQVSMWMPDPHLIDFERKVQIEGIAYSLCIIDTGVPHAVVFVDHLKDQDVEQVGRKIRSHKIFQPHGTNVDFVEALNDTAIAIRTYERGVEGETLACGTGAVAAGITAVLLQRVPGRIVDKKAVPHLILPLEVQERLHKSQERRRERQERLDFLVRSMSRRILVNVQTHSRETLKVSFHMTGRVKERTRPQVTDVILEGAAKRIFDGAAPWQKGNVA